MSFFSKSEIEEEEREIKRKQKEEEEETLLDSEEMAKIFEIKHNKKEFDTMYEEIGEKCSLPFSFPLELKNDLVNPTQKRIIELEIYEYLDRDTRLGFFVKDKVKNKATDEWEKDIYNFYSIGIGSSYIKEKCNLTSDEANEGTISLKRALEIAECLIEDKKSEKPKSDKITRRKKTRRRR